MPHRLDDIDRLRRLQAVTDAGLRHLSLDDLLDEMLTRVRDALGADTAAVLLLDDRRRDLVARAAKGLEEEVERGVRVPVGKGFAGRVVSERRSIVIDDVEHADIVNPLLREKGLQSLLGSPLVVTDEIIGVVHVGSLSRRHFSDDDIELLEAAADRVALAIEHSRLYEQTAQRANAALALEHVGDGVFLLDVAGRIQYWNRAAELITGVGARLAIGRPVSEVITPWESVAGIVPVSLHPSDTRAETVPLEVEGRELWLSISGSGFPGGTVYAFRDITEQRRLDEWQNEFIATVAHEFRTPMASVFGAAATLRRNDVELGGELRAELLEIIYNEADRLARLINDILIASRIQVGRLEVNEQAFDAGKLTLAVAQSVQAHAREGVTIAVEAPPAAPLVNGDPDKVKHVLVNLVENAVKYSPAGGEVRVALEPQERHMRFSVADEGLGIPAPDRKHIFEKFYRAESHARLGISGTGLGLYISRELVRRMHGRIWVTSEEGKGSTFYFELPLAAVRAVA